MLIMLSVPILEGIAFWLILRRPTDIPNSNGHVTYDAQNELSSTSKAADGIRPNSREDIEQNNKCNEFDTPFGLKEKILYLPSLLKYMIPITLVYFLEYFINQGLVSSCE